MRALDSFSSAVLRIDPAAVAGAIEHDLRDAVIQRLRRRGVVVGLSGGIDSSVVAALAVRALGADRVIGLLMPEAESSGDSLRLGRALAGAYGIRVCVEDITATLEATGCYRRRDEAIRSIVPEYGSGYRCKIVPPDMIDKSSYAVYWSSCRRRRERNGGCGSGRCRARHRRRRNFKQRVRKMMSTTMPTASSSRSPERQTFSSTTRASS